MRQRECPGRRLKQSRTGATRRRRDLPGPECHVHSDLKYHILFVPGIHRTAVNPQRGYNGRRHLQFLRHPPPQSFLRIRQRHGKPAQADHPIPSFPVDVYKRQGQALLIQETGFLFRRRV